MSRRNKGNHRKILASEEGGEEDEERRKRRKKLQISNLWCIFAAGKNKIRKKIWQNQL